MVTKRNITTSLDAEEAQRVKKYEIDSLFKEKNDKKYKKDYKEKLKENGETSIISEIVDSSTIDDSLKAVMES
jgi:hypothetical protein